MHGTAQTAILSAWDWPPCKRIPQSPYGVVRRGELRLFQAVYADRAVSQACVDCHNRHPNSPRRDFKLNDVMGGIIITFPIGS